MKNTQTSIKALGVFLFLVISVFSQLHAKTVTNEFSNNNTDSITISSELYEALLEAQRTILEATSELTKNIHSDSLSADIEKIQAELEKSLEKINQEIEQCESPERIEELKSIKKGITNSLEEINTAVYESIKTEEIKEALSNTSENINLILQDIGADVDEVKSILKSFFQTIADGLE